MSKTIDFDVLKKFNQQGPRYTSYPTAPVFSPEFTADDFKQEIVDTNKNNSRPLSLYFHFPFCAKLCYFCGCTMRVTHDRQLISDYNDHIKKEIDLLSPLISKNRKVVQMHWGGGTPSYLLPEEIREVGNYIKERFDFADDIEASVEIDPRNMVRDHIEAFAESGFNRTSFGVQDFNLRVQQAINRIQSEEITREVVTWAREFGFQSVNLDLIYGLPYQTVETFSETVDKVIDISPERIAVFNYADVPWLKKHQSVMDQDAMPSADQRLAILKMTSEKLTDAGYEYIGMDHFAKPTDELAIAQKEGTLYRNFQGYSTKAGADLYAFGMSAISQFENIYAQNQKDFRAYYAALEAGEPATRVGYRMTKDDHIRRETIMRLMCDLEIDKGRIENEFGIDFEDYFRNDIPKLEPFIREGLVINGSDKIRVIDSGILIIRNIAMCFDAYLEEMMHEAGVLENRLEMNEKIGVVLLNLGGPDSLDAVEPFLFNLFSDPDIIDFPLSFLFRKRLAKMISTRRAPMVIEQYREIGGKSPLKDHTLRQARLLEEKLSEKIPAKVYAAMRYWNPSTDDALNAIEADGINRVILLPLYPQYSMATTASSHEEFEKRANVRSANIDTTLIESYFEHPTYVDAFVERISEGLDRFPADARDDVKILFSAHGTPIKLVRRGDPYSRHIAKTVNAIMRRGRFTQMHTVCYQSKVGPMKWLTPSTPDTIADLASNGNKYMLLVPVAFTSDHLETLFELGIEYRRQAKEKGVLQYEVTEGLNDSSTFIQALAELVLEKVGIVAQRDAEVVR